MPPPRVIILQPLVQKLDDESPSPTGNAVAAGATASTAPLAGFPPAASDVNGTAGSHRKCAVTCTAYPYLSTWCSFAPVCPFFLFASPFARAGCSGILHPHGGQAHCRKACATKRVRCCSAHIKSPKHISYFTIDRSDIILNCQQGTAQAVLNIFIAALVLCDTHSSPCAHSLLLSAACVE
jgi:hypothetical protein